MTRTYDLYGSKDGTVDELTAVVAAALNVTMEPHESSAYGEYNRTPGIGGETISVQPNYVDYGEEEDELIEGDFPEYSVIVRITKTYRGEEIQARLAEKVPQLDFLRRDPL